MQWLTEKEYQRQAVNRTIRRKQQREAVTRRIKQERLLRRIDFLGAILIAILAGYLIRMLMA